MNFVTLTLYSSPEGRYPPPSEPSEPCREAATKTLGGEAAVRPENPWAIGPSILRTFGAQRAPNYIDML